MFVATFMKYIFLTLTTLHLLDIAVASSPNFDSYRDLLDYLYRHGYIKSVTIKKAMSLVDRKFFVTEKPYEDSSQPTAYGVKILAPHVDALVLGALESRLQHSGHVSCILCHGGYLPSVMALYVTNTGIIVGIEKDGRVTNLNYNNIEKWIKSSEIAQKYRLFRHLPFKFYTRSNPGDEVLSIEFSATFYNGDDKNTIVKLKQRLKRGGRLVYLKSIGKEGQTLMVIDRRSNGSFYERLLARVRLDGSKVEEAEKGDEELDRGKGEEWLGGGKEMEESLEEMEETLTPQPVPPPFADFDDILISSVQIKHIPDIKIILLIVCIAVMHLMHPTILM